MAQIVKLRRSSVSGQKPTNSNLQLGELALNTTDGKVFMAKSGSSGPSIEELISTNTVNTGSIHLIGDITSSNVSSSFIGDGGRLYNIPLSGVTNLTTISGSLDNRLDTLEAYSSSQLVPSSSMSFRTLQTDVYVKNMSGVQINKGTVVRIVGSVGDNPLIGVASFLTEGQSANTLGIAAENIPNDSFGLVITEGILVGVDTQGMTAGQLIFLGANGTFTTSYPTAPNHGVRLGEVLRDQQNQGSIYVRVDNGAELGESHDVYDTTTNSSYGDLLVKSGSVWVNSRSLNGNYSVTGSLTITQNLTVLGSSSLVYVTSSNLAVSASFISVNVFEPAERFGGLKVYDSGSSNATASLAWDSLNNHWVYQNASGSSYSGGMLLAGPRNTGSLGDEVGLINGRIAKSVGGDHLDNSIISESGTTITVLGDLVANSITGSFDFYGLVNRPTLVSGSSQIEITGTTGYSTFSSSISTSIGELSSSIATTTNDLDSRLDSIEGVTGSYATTGSNLFKGNQTISGSVIIGTGSLDITSPEILHVENSGSYNVAQFVGYNDNYGQVTIQNKFNGNESSTDLVIVADNGTETIHYVDLGINSSTYDYGYVGYENDAYLLNVGKNLYVGTVGSEDHSSDLILFAENSWENPQVVISGSKQISFNTSSVSNGYQYEFSGSIKADHDLNVVGNITGSNISGSFIGDGSRLYNIPMSGVTGIELNKIVSGSVSASISPDNGLQINTDVYIDGTLTAKELHIDYVTSSVLYQSGSTKFGDTTDDNHNFTGSVYINGNLDVDSITGSIDFSNLTNVPTLVSGSSQISYTEITDVPSGIVSGSSQIIDLGFLTTGSFETYTSSVDTVINNITLLTSSYVLNADTASMTVLSSSYAVTASYALAVLGGSGSDGRTAKLEQTAPSTTWTFDHYLGERFPAIEVFNSDGFVIIPSNIEAVDGTRIIITFSSAQTGYATATVGGGIPAISGSYDGRVLAVSGSAASWKSGIISGSLQIVEHGFTTTGSNSFNGNQTITGSLTIANTKMGSLCTTSVGNNIILALNDFDGATIDYVVKYDGSRRFGTIMGVWDGAQYEYTETSTMDIGNTDDITFNIDASGNLHAVSTLHTWEITLSYRALGC